ncbi:iron-sulfur cluster assembly scaffold protein [Ochrobactrum pecoris]|uniref:Iron-sulfur cluster assembly scaffold protein n=1 Tax=Brucella pecoris TaxID=867683 RepID=A0A5C5CJH3_9HYPH|nr:iron-sulfur cluster assembly scaffold protein [Brucella pecoris]MBB4094825.1 SUF system NifU family Fe-S assembly protein [Brucella pecoris]NKW80290.1 iron-sulfur cluster assembly scaffold protein [Brucella pecoris]TNV11245.1 iron-sulfur cluster assembly scaffold protein [Brucella pecoris]
MIDDIYNKRILEFAGNMERLGRLPEPDAVAKVHSKLCGSTVTVYLKMTDGIVTDFAHEVKACALGQASSSVMARNIIGASAEELKAVRDEMYKMLKEEGPAPEGRFTDLKYFEPVREYRARHASTLLTFDAVVDCIRQIDEKAKAA